MSQSNLIYCKINLKNNIHVKVELWFIRNNFKNDIKSLFQLNIMETSVSGARFDWLIELLKCFFFSKADRDQLIKLDACCIKLSYAYYGRENPISFKNYLSVLGSCPYVKINQDSR